MLIDVVSGFTRWDGKLLQSGTVCRKEDAAQGVGDAGTGMQHFPTSFLPFRQRGSAFENNLLLQDKSAYFPTKFSASFLFLFLLIKEN